MSSLHAQLGKEYAELGRIVELYSERQRLVKDDKSLDSLLRDSKQQWAQDDEMAALASEEKEALQATLADTKVRGEAGDSNTITDNNTITNVNTLISLSLSPPTCVDCRRR